MLSLRLRYTRLIVAAFLALLLAGLLVAAAEAYTLIMADAHCHSSAAQCGDDKRVGLVLGCSKKIGPYNNLYFIYRIEAAVELWQAGKLSCIIVSGDNSSPYYNEPRDMCEALVERGVPRELIIEDFAGLCTYDSVVRANRIFGADKMLIVSQPGHVRRAVAIARSMGIDAEGYEASERGMGRSSRLRQALRERCARISMLYDLISQREPLHMGSPVALPQPDAATPN